MPWKSSEKLKSYREKRDFRRTAEPAGEGGAAGEKPRFVIQKHQARTLHYDFRLEADGVLKSWAVPKGPSTDPRTKRLAVPTEDHPLDYADFEGTIPEGEYGAGAVLVWDTGTYENMKKDEETGEPVSMADSLEQGHVIVRLEGRKLQGGYALIRTGKGEDAKWLLIKMRDEHADARRNPTSTEPQSVLSDRTLEEIAAEEG
jgi:DNA ligase D-like protein (predicted 3'-phosphoesterase)